MGRGGLQVGWIVAAPGRGWEQVDGVSGLQFSAWLGRFTVHGGPSNHPGRDAQQRRQVRYRAPQRQRQRKWMVGCAAGRTRPVLAQRAIKLNRHFQRSSTPNR